MASTISSFFYPQALARPNTGNPRRSSNSKKIKLPNRNNSKKPPLKSSPLNGSEATSYTRLPPRDDFVVDYPLEFSSHVIKLSESGTNLLESSKKRTGIGNEVFEGVQGEEEEEEEEESVMVFGYDEEFEVFEGNDGEEEEVFEEGEELIGFEDENGEGNSIDFDEIRGILEEDEEGEFVDLDEEDDQVKEKGVPAVMRCFDRAKVYAKAGDGGNGVVAFRREKYVPFGGPSGGDGGRGGNVYLEVDGAMNSLLPFRNSIHFRAGRGSHGQGRKMAGARGDDVIIKVAPGTVVRESGKEEVLFELLKPGKRALLLPGGRGGRGNASFKSGFNKAPRIAENGEEGPEMWLELELKLVADVGIVGAPNAGKSTLLSVISAAQPTIANYPFTTLLPNLGVVSFDYDSTIVVADLPGLLEGAHRGFGLGHEFLRHTERCSALVHVVDGSVEQPGYEFDAVRLELELFNPELADKPFVVAFNKMDLPEAYEKWPTFKENLQARGIKTFCMSAVKREGTYEVICAANELLQERKQTDENAEGWNDPEDLNHVADTIKKQRNASINEFEIAHEATTNTWHVNGSGIQRFVQMTNWRYADSDKRFQHVLDACGVNKSLKKLGVKEGDTVIVGEMELVWHDSKDSGSSNVRRKAGDIRWHDLK